MKATFAKKRNNILLKDILKPKPDVNEVLVKVAYCGVCGTDIGMAYSDCDEYTPIGHEFSGEIVALGSGVKHLTKGDRITAECSTACGVCKACREGRELSCTDITSFFAKESAFAEYIKIPARNAVKIGDMDYKTAALIEPFSVALCMVNLAELTVDDEILIIGVGPIGLLALAACRKMGVKNIYVVGREYSKARLKMAAKLGADCIITPSGSNMRKMLEKLKIDGFDKILITANPSTISDSVHLSKKGGIISYIGYSHGDDKVTIDTDVFHVKHLQLRAYDGPAKFFQRAKNLLEQSIIPDDFISHVFKLDDIKEAIRTAAEEKEKSIKILVQI
ncbi:MAG TPA: alcohol dehydrogenase catalytic domain-containing protein [Victivallales bacterium]|nr:alcohol dehydrogenase catalytic domain-containing protein [Victivallales bacterium]